MVYDVPCFDEQITTSGDDFFLTAKDVLSSVRSFAFRPEATLTGGRRHIPLQHLGPGVTAVVEWNGDLPTWLSEAIQRLTRLTQLQQNWNSYGARPVRVNSIVAALDTLHSVMSDDTPLPEFVPTPRGTIQFEWHIHGIELEVDALSPGQVRVSYEDLRGINDGIEDLITTNLDVVRGAVSTIVARG